MYGANDIERILEQIKSFGLTRPVGMLGNENLCSIFNGVGCEHEEHIPSKLRKILNRVMAFAECSAAIHDYCYYYSDGTESGREYADKMFRDNMLDEIRARNVRFKWLKEWIALRAFEAVRKCGRSDWCIAFAERMLAEDAKQALGSEEK